MTQIGREKIQIQIENAIFCWRIIKIFVKLKFIFDANHFSDDARTLRWDDVISDIARKIRKIPRIFEIGDLTRVKNIFIGPQIRVFIDVDEFKIWFQDSSLNGFTPEKKRMIMVVKNDDFRKIGKGNVNKIFESKTGFEFTIFHLFKNHIFFRNSHIIYRSKNPLRNHQIRIFSKNFCALVV